MTTVFPGDELSSLIESHIDAQQRRSGSLTTGDEPVRIQVGPGIIQNATEVVALKAGRFQPVSVSSTNKFVLVSAQKRYVPVQNDLVVGIVTARLAEMFRVDIGAQTTATLSLLTGFEATARKTRPTWPVGTVIFARVALAHPDLEPELACFDGSGNVPSDLFGELTPKAAPTTGGDGNAVAPTATVACGQLLRTSCHFSRSLQNPRAVPLLAALGRHFAFEVAAGANGRIYLEAANVKETLLLARIIETAGREMWGPEECERAVLDAAIKCEKRTAGRQQGSNV